MATRWLKTSVEKTNNMRYIGRCSECGSLVSANQKLHFRAKSEGKICTLCKRFFKKAKSPEQHCIESDGSPCMYYKHSSNWNYRVCRGICYKDLKQQF